MSFLCFYGLIIKSTYLTDIKKYICQFFYWTAICRQHKQSLNMQRERSRSHAFVHRNRSSSLESIDSKLLTTTIQLSPNKTDRRDRIRDGTMLKKSTDARTYGENNQRSAAKSLNQNSSDLDCCTGNRRSDDHLFNHLSYQSNRNQSNSRKFKNEITISQSDRHFQSSSILSSLKNQPQQQHHNTSNRSIQTAARAIPPSWGLTQQEILIRNTEQLSLIENGLFQYQCLRCYANIAFFF